MPYKMQKYLSLRKTLENGNTSSAEQARCQFHILPLMSIMDCFKSTLTLSSFEIHLSIKLLLELN